MANDSFISFLMDLRFTFYFYSLHHGYILYFSIVCVSIGMRDYPNEFIGWHEKSRNHVIRCTFDCTDTDKDRSITRV